MAIEKNDALLNFTVGLNKDLLKKDLESVSSTIAETLSKVLSKTTKNFGKELGQNIQVAFDATIIGALKKPIKITLDTKDAQDKINKLVKPLTDVVNKTNQKSETTQSTAKNEATNSQSVFKQIEQLKELGKVSEKIGLPAKTIQRQIDGLISSYVELAKKGVSVENSTEKLFTDSQVATLDRYNRKVKYLIQDLDLLGNKENKKLSDTKDKSEFNERGVKNFQSSLTPQYLENVNKKLTEQRKKVTDLDVPLVFVNKITRQYDSTLINVEKNLEDLNREFKAGNITIEDANRGYQKIAKDLRVLEIGIEKINPNRLKEAFDLEQNDPRQLSYRIGILGFTLQTVGGTLSNFSQQFFQAFDQISQASEPIQRVQNSLNLQAKQGELTLQQVDSTLERLRSIGDLPGSSVESANETFNSLQKVNLSLEKRLDLTEGIAKIAASPGGTKDSAKQFADVIAAISLEKSVDDDRFKTLRRSGGTSVSKLIDSLGFQGGEDIEKFGINKFIDKVAQSLIGLKAPADTTTDKMNRLRSRLGELGVIVGKVVGPGLDSLNRLLKDSIIPILEILGKTFDNLNPKVKEFISNFVIAIPVIAGIGGALLTTVAALGFAVSGFKQVKDLAPALKGLLSGGAATGSGVVAGIAPGIAATTVSITALSKATLNLSTIFKTTFSVLAFGPLKLFTNFIQMTVATLPTLIKSLTSFKGIATLLSTGLTGVGGGLAKILGLTNPIGIAINILLSAVTAFFSNFNGVRDRLNLVFSELDTAVRGLLKEFGINGGILYVLGKIVDALNAVFGFIGEIILDVVIAVAATIRDVLNNITKIISLLKQGNLIGALGEGLKLIVNTLLGTIKNFVIELLATVIDAIINLIKLIPGAKESPDLISTISGASTVGKLISLISPNTGKSINDDPANYLRSLNGTDKASLANKRQNDEEIERLTNRQNREKQIDKEKIEAEVEAEKERQERLKLLDKELKDSNKKAKEDFIKFRLDQKIEQYKTNIDAIKDSTSAQLDNFKQAIELTSNAEQVTKSYASILETVNNNQKNLLANQGQIGLSDSLREFNSLTSKTQDGFKQIFEQAELGNPVFKRLADSITAATNSTSTNQLASALQNVQNLAKGTDAEGIVNNVVEKSRVSIEKNNRDTQNYIQEYRKVLIDIAKIEVARKSAIELEKRNIEFEKTNREIEQKNRLKQLDDQIKLANLRRNGVSEQTIANVENQSEFNSRRTETQQSQRDIEKKIEDLKTQARNNLNNIFLTAQLNQQQMEAIASGAGGNITQFGQQILSNNNIPIDKLQDSILALTNDNKLVEYLKRTNTEFDTLNNQLTTTGVNFQQYEKKQDQVFNSENIDRKVNFFEKLSQSIALLSQLSSEGLDKFKNSLNRFSLDVKSGDNLDDLSNTFDFLVNKTKELSLSSPEINKINKLIKQIEDGSIDASEGIKKINDELVNVAATDAIRERVKLQKEFNQLLINYNSSTLDFKKSKDKVFSTSDAFSLPSRVLNGASSVDYTGLSGDDLGKLIVNAAGTAGKTDSQKQGDFLLNRVSESIKQLSDDGRYLIGEFETNLYTLRKDNALTYEAITNEFLATINNLSEQDKNFFLDSLFGLESTTTGATNIRLETLEKAIKLFTATNNVNATIIKEKIKLAIEEINRTSVNKISDLDQQILNAQNKLSTNQQKLGSASGDEFDRLANEQRDISLQLIRFNYERLDIEEAYNIQKALLQAEGNKGEKDRIIEQGKIRRQELLNQYKQELTDKVLSQGGSFDKSGNLLNSQNISVPTAQPALVTNTSKQGDQSGTQTNAGTAPVNTGNEISSEISILASIKRASNGIDGVFNDVRDAALEAGDAVLDFMNKLSSGDGIINAFKKKIFGIGDSVLNIREIFEEFAKFGIAAFGQAFAQAFTDTLVNGGNFLKTLGKIMGDLLIQVGSMLISLGAASLAFAALAFFFPGIVPPQWALGTGAALGAIAAGTGLIVAGKLLGGGGSKSTVESSNTNTSNSANSSAGNSGEVEYDPEKDPKMIYQKALQAQVMIDIKTDDGQIVKTFIKTLSRNERLSNLVGNNRTGIVL